MNCRKLILTGLLAVTAGAQAVAPTTQGEVKKNKKAPAQYATGFVLGSVGALSGVATFISCGLGTVCHLRNLHLPGVLGNVQSNYTQSVVAYRDLSKKDNNSVILPNKSSRELIPGTLIAAPYRIGTPLLFAYFSWQFAKHCAEKFKEAVSSQEKKQQPVTQKSSC